MGVSNGGGGGSATITGAMQGTIASRPAASAAPAGAIYWSTDTGEFFVNNLTQTAWANIVQIGSTGGTTLMNTSSPQWRWGNMILAGNNFGFTVSCGGGAFFIQNQTATLEATAATAGTNGAVPAQVRGYFIFRDSTNTNVKVPYFAV